jgi:hypothetical protein
MDRSIIDTIVKFIKELYKPEDVVVSLLSHTGIDGIDRPEYYIYVYFDYIDDKYLKNPTFHDKVRNKEIHLRLEIRKYVDSYFGIKTSGVTLNGFSPFEYRGLTIDVKSNEEDY